MVARLLGFGRTILLVVAASVWLSPVAPANALGPDNDGGSRADLLKKLQNNPAELFLDGSRKPLAIAGVISTVREIVIAEKTSLQPIVDALKFASTEEKSAIGTGLGQAAQAVVKSDPAYAAEIQEALAKAVDTVAIAAFAAATGNIPTGAIGGGGAGAAGGAGGSSVDNGRGTGSGSAGSGGGAGGGQSNPFVLNAAALTFNAGTSSGTASSGSSSVTSASTSVSP